LNIGLFAPYDLARAGGVASHIRAQARALRSLGHRVQVYGPASAPLPDGEVALGGSMALTVGGTTSGVAFDPRIALRLARVTANERFDVVHVHEPLMPLLSWCAVWFANAPVVATFHVHREGGHPFYPVAKPLLAPIARRIAARIAVSDAARRTAARYFPGEYEIIPNGIELRRFQTPRPRPARVDAPAVVCVGRLEPRKGAATLIRAMAEVRRQVPGATLVMVGDGPEAGTLERLARDTAARVTFVGKVPDDELPAYYQSANVVCAPALGGESFGIVLLEALAAGKQVVASRIEGYVSAVGQNRSVTFVAPGDVTSLARALVACLARPDEAPPDDGVRLAAEHDWARIAERLLAVYRRVARTPARSLAHA
jgi:phosphatidylinositol alpha-mannosyltransferase